jgi:antitoxin component of RelBE/YafQ-DinJ toxin-antitoxin module
MDAGAVIKHSAWLVASAAEDIKAEASRTSNFLDYSDVVRSILLEKNAREEEVPFDVREFAEALRRLRDNYESEVAADPMCVYVPAHTVALDFHRSTAMVRYFRAPNRSSKTESGCADNYWVTTGQHPHRKTPTLPCSVFIIGKNFSKYGTTFEKKYLLGEEGNPLSPVFPEGGKWLNRYDPKKHIIYIACSECANKGQAQRCKHLKSTIQLFSDREGPMVLAGGQYAQGQFDEHISEEFYTESLMRLQTVPFGNLMITHTPLEGKGAWEHLRVTKQFLDGGEANLVPGTDRKIVDLFTLDQFAAGLVPHEQILALLKNMPPAEAESRVWGRPSAFSKSGVFDTWMISEMEDDVRPHEVAALHTPDGKKSQEQYLRKSGRKAQIHAKIDLQASLKIWERPFPYGQYVIGADVAQGLTGGDYSCAVVLKLVRRGGDMCFEMVAQYHGHINSLAYAEELMKLAIYYNSATLVVERRGPGDATLHRLKELGYWNLFRDLSDPSQATFTPDALFGVDTNVKTKGIFISMLQNTIKDARTGERTIIIPDHSTLEELGHFGQEMTETGLSYRFKALGGMHDDRVMALALAVYAARVYPGMYSVEDERKAQALKRRKHTLSPMEQKIWADYRKEIKERNRSDF